MKINEIFVEKVLTAFIKNELYKFNFSRGILGLSGGLDSSVCAFLAAKSLGKTNVFALIMPYGDTYPQDVDDAREVADLLGINSRIIDISPMVDAYFKIFPTSDRIIIGNKMARERMSILYDFSVREKALILGTSNKTESLLGYGTLHGDMASAINPIGDLYKTQIRQLAAHLGVPTKIIKKTPTAGLWPGQTDEKELGMTYKNIDMILYQLVDLRRTPADLLKKGFDKKNIERITRLIKSSEFKRKLPPIAKLSWRTVGLNFLYSFDREK